MKKFLVPTLLACLAACQSAPAPVPIQPVEPVRAPATMAPPDERAPVEAEFAPPLTPRAGPIVGGGSPPRDVAHAAPRRRTRAATAAPREGPGGGSASPEAGRESAAPRIGARAQAPLPGGNVCPSPGECDVQEGRGGFAKPPEMWVNTPETIEFFVAPDDAGIELEAEGAEMGATRNLYIGSVMRVTLRPHSNFEILSANGVAKPLGRDRRESWQWEVKPKQREGEFTLFADVAILESMDAGARVLEAYPRRVKVNVRVGTWDGFLNAVGKAKSVGEILSTLFRSWETALISLTALVVALGGLIVALRNLGPKGRERRTARREKRATKKAERGARRQELKA